MPQAEKESAPAQDMSFEEAMSKLDNVQLPLEKKSMLRDYAGSLLYRVL